MKHVQPPSDGEVLPLDPADDDPLLLPRRSTAAIWPRARRRSLHRVAAETNTSNGCKERARDYLDAGEPRTPSPRWARNSRQASERSRTRTCSCLGGCASLTATLPAMRAWVEDFR